MPQGGDADGQNLWHAIRIPCIPWLSRLGAWPALADDGALLPVWGWCCSRLLALPISACGFAVSEGRRLDSYLGPGWPQPDQAFQEAALPALRAELPEIAGAKYVDDDDECASCHESLVETFAQNVHHGIRKGQSCEACHGPGSKHVETEGKTPGLIWSFKDLSRPQQAEICGRCHEEDACAAGAQWRTSVHAHRGVSCLDCHDRAHYERQPEKPQPSGGAGSEAAAGQVAVPASHREASETEPVRRVPSNNLVQLRPQVCYRCHGDMADLQRLAGPHQIGGPNGFNCTSCHDPHGQIEEATRKDLCLSCHKGIADHGLAFVDPQHRRRGLHRLPQPASARASRRSSTSSTPRYAVPSGSRCRSRSRKPATSAISRSTA